MTHRMDESPSVLGTSSGRERSRGARAALPIVIGYVPIGLAYGVLGRAAGVPVWAIVLMSLVVYAGSAQFLAVSLLGQGAAAAAIVTTTLLVNLRHVLYGSALTPRLEGMDRRRLAWVAAELTDESFVVATGSARAKGTRLTFPFMSGLQGVAQVSWVSGSVLGALAASLITDPSRYGLDFALVAMFLGLLALQMRERRDVAVACIAGAVSLGLTLLGVGTSGVILATLVASGLGLLLPDRTAGGGARPDEDRGEGHEEDLPGFAAGPDSVPPDHLGDVGPT
jgi:4-azaleucine resistance transporter AzlC